MLLRPTNQAKGGMKNDFIFMTPAHDGKTRLIHCHPLPTHQVFQHDSTSRFICAPKFNVVHTPRTTMLRYLLKKF